MTPLSPNDLIETRRLNEKLTMRFPADPDSTAKLLAVCAMVPVREPPPTLRQRLIRLFCSTPPAVNEKLQPRGSS